MSHGTLTAGRLRAALLDVADDTPVHVLIDKAHAPLQKVRSGRPNDQTPYEWVILEGLVWNDPRDQLAERQAHALSRTAAVGPFDGYICSAGANKECENPLCPRKKSA